MNNEKQGWKQFNRVKLDRKKLMRRAKKMENATNRHAHRFVIRRLENIKSVSREVTIWLAIVCAIVGGMGIQMLWGQMGYTTSAESTGGTYVEGVVGAIDTLNPLFASTTAEASVGRLVFSSLYNYDETGAIHQDLATGMNIDESRRVYTVTIRPDAAWHDGKPVTARDVVFTINLIKNPLVRSPLRVNWTDVTATASNDRTVQFTLPAVYAAFPNALTFPVLPQHLLSAIAPSALRESVFSQAPVGSGPFAFKLLQQADTVSQHRVVHLSANSKYYDGQPKVRRMEIHAFRDTNAMVRALRVGELSAASDVSPLALDQVQGARFTRVAAPTNNGVYLLLNLNNLVLKDVAVRRALQVGTDSSGVREAVGGDQLALDLPVLPSQLSGAEVPSAPAYDAVRAGNLLDEAGWKLVGKTREKDGKKLELTITTTKDPEYERVLKTVQGQWQKIGIAVTLKVVDTSSLASTFIQDTLQARNFDVLLYELAIGADPDVYAYWHSSQIGQTGYNFSNYSNKTVDANLASARSRLEPDLRNAKYRQFVKQWLEDAPAIGLYQPVIEYVTTDTAKALRPNSRLVTAVDRYANVQYWTLGKETVYKTP